MTSTPQASLAFDYSELWEHHYRHILRESAGKLEIMKDWHIERVKGQSDTAEAVKDKAAAAAYAKLAIVARELADKDNDA